MLKTKKAIQKRIKLTKKGKSLHRPIKQSHFKSKLSGRDKQKKRKQITFFKANEKIIKRFLPYQG